MRSPWRRLVAMVRPSHADRDLNDERPGLPFLETSWQDLRHGSRSLRRSPGFTAAAIVTLTLGVGSTAAIFSVARAVVFKPLPYTDPGRRVMVWSQWVGFEKTWVSEAELFDYRTRCATLAQVAAWGTTQVNLTGGAEPLRIGVGRITANTFETLGVRPVLGRGFTREEDVPGRNTVAVISHGLWQRHFGGEAGAVGKTLRLDGTPYTVVGVMPPEFQLPTDYGEDAAEPTELWVPLAIDMQEIERGSHGLYAAALLSPGATPESATAELRALTAGLTREGLYPEAMKFSAFAVGLEEEVLGTVRPALYLLLGAVGFLLLIACANVASLLLARSETRQRDVAVRAALGAGRGRLVRHVLAESLILAGVGSFLGLVVALGAGRALAALSPVGIPRAAAVGVDLQVFGFTTLLALLTTGVFGLVPALRALQVAPVKALREAAGGRSTAGTAGRRLRNALVVGEVALAVVLVIGAGLMIRSLRSLQEIDLGFRPQGVLTARLWLPQASYAKPEHVVAFYQQLLDRVRALPGVEVAGLVRLLPLGATIGDYGLTIESDPNPGITRAKGDWQVATDGAFEALGERLVRGRLLSPRDTTDAEQVAVVNETMARTYWPNRDPIGQRFRMGRANRGPWVTVVGVVGNERHNGITAVVKEKFYRPHSQFHKSTGSPARGMTLVIRTAGDPASLAGPVRRVVASMDATLPVAAIRPMTEIVDASITMPRLTGAVLVLFALLALSLAAVGIYGVLSYLVNERTHEIGVRVAIGASAGQVLRLVLARALALTAMGLAFGLAGAASLTRLMSGVLYGVTPLDPLTFLAVPALLAAVAALASYLPARRASRIDPMLALRIE